MSQHKSIDQRQSHRFRRYLMAVYTSLFFLVLMFGLARMGMMDEAGFPWVAGATLFFIVLFAAMFRSGVNLRFADPSLTAWQMGSSIAVLTLAMYFCSSDGRGVLLPVFLVSFLFGALRLQTRELFFIGMIVSLCYGAMILLLLEYRPAAIDLRLEWLRWIVTTAALVWFALIGGYLSRMRKQLSDQNAELEKALQTIQNLATHDSLTGIPNRRYLEQAMEQERARSERYDISFCLCLVDIDHFKLVNDTHGHQSGDEVLKAFAEKAMQGLRKADHFGRFGGEEFLAILTETALDGAQCWAEHLRTVIESMTIPGLPPDFRVTVSIGIAQFRAGEGMEKTISRADKGLYQAKTSGRNRIATAAFSDD